MGKPIDVELAAAREFATKLRAPALYLQKLDRVESGDLSDKW
jgi:hypothetical protein